MYSSGVLNLVVHEQMLTEIYVKCRRITVTFRFECIRAKANLGLLTDNTTVSLFLPRMSKTILLSVGVYNV